MPFPSPAFLAPHALVVPRTLGVTTHAVPLAFRPFPYPRLPAPSHRPPPCTSRTTRPPAPCCCTNTAPPPPSKPLSTRLGDALYRTSTLITNLFPVWTVLASAVAVTYPTVFASAISPRLVSLALSGLMLSTGLTLTFSELRQSLRRPILLTFAFLACYGAMPLLAISLSRLFCLDDAMTGGLILLGIMSGGQASNLCTLIAGGDTALSVAMTTLTTLSAAVALPFLSELLLGTVLELNSLALARSTAQIVLLPILSGALLNKVAGRLVARIRPALPVAGIAMLLVLIVGPVASTAAVIRVSIGQLALPVALLHVGGGVVGYVVPRVCGAGERVAVTTGFETGFKSPALSFVLACKHFREIGMRVPSAVSIIVLAPLAAIFAVGLRFRGRGGGRGNGRGGVVGVARRVVGGVRGRGSGGGGAGTGVGRKEGRAAWFRVTLADGSWKVVRYGMLGVELGRARRAGKRVLSVTSAGGGAE